MKSPEIIIFFPSIEKGGADKNLFMLSNFLASKLDKVSILTCSSKYKYKFQNLNFIGPNYKFFDNFGRNIKTLVAIFYLIKILFEKKNLLILSFQSNIFSIFICKLFSTKIITRSNSFPDDWTNNFFKKKIFKIMYKLTDKSIVNSVEVKKKFSRLYNINCTHIYNPINKSKIFKLSKKNVGKFYKNMNKLKIIIVGRLSKEKDHITFLKSLKILSKKTDFESIILGSGNQKKIIQKTILEFNLQKKIRMINFKKNPYPYIKQSDILVLSSIHEGLPNVLIEAAALKTFVISSNCETGPKEILLNGKAGALFNVGDYEGLAKKILYYQNKKQQRKKMIQKGFENLNRFDYETNLQKYYDHIKLCF